MTLSEQAIKYDTRNWSRGMDALYTARMLQQCDRFGDPILAFSLQAGRLNRYVLELAAVFRQKKFSLKKRTFPRHSGAQGMTTINPGLVILHSNRLETLRDTAIVWGRNYPLKPLENDVFLVQSNGMAQWLKLAFAAADGYGISAAHQFLMPSRFLWQAYRRVLGASAVPTTSPFDESRLIWRIYRWLSRVLPALAADSAEASLYAPLRRYLLGDALTGAAIDFGKCFGLAQKLADLFDQYQVYRADWLNAWQEGRDVLPDVSAGKPAGAALADAPPVPETQQWQPALWRALTREVDESLQHSGRSHVHQAFLDALRDPRYKPVGLPRRLQVFGLSSMPTQMLEAIEVLARHVQVLVYVVNPCQHYWIDIMDGGELLGITRARHARKPGLPPLLPMEQLALKTNPLLAAWGKQGRDFIGLLYRYDPDEVSHAKIDLFESPVALVSAAHPPRLLHHLQQAVFDLQPLPETPEERLPVSSRDRSLQFHVCHSRQREVEVLHDRLLDVFERHPELQPRDVIVMAPDIDRYAAHVEAVFGNVARGDARHIPYTLADRPERACHPMAKALETLLRLPELRLSVSDVLSLLEVAALRERFGIAETDLPVLQRWMVQSGIRWGLNAEQRESLDLPADLQCNTWQFGLRRVLLGYACGRGEAWQGVAPFGAVAGLEGDLAGKLLQTVETIEQLWRQLLQEHAPEAWGEILQALLNQFFLPQDEADELLLRRVENAIHEWRIACTEGGLGDEPLPLLVVREAMMSALEGEGLSQRFLAGCVNFCTLMPMRSIPFKVVCLLGMCDGEYPRHRVALDFDLMNGRYRPGDRSRREDDRYLFLEAMLSARELLYVSYVGRSIRDDSERPPSVLVAQLRDYLSAAYCFDDSDHRNDSDVARGLTWLHPLQPFSVKYFQGDPDWFTYASEWREIHRAPEEQDHDTALSAYVRDEALTLDELTRFLRQPVDYFYAQRLKVRFPRMDEDDMDCETFALDGLDRYSLGQDLIERRRLFGSEFPATVQRWRREGLLPAAAWGELAVSEVVSGAEDVWQVLQEHAERYPDAVEPLEIQLQVNGVRIEDWVGGICRGPAGQALMEWRATASRGKSASGVKFHYFLPAWVKQVCLAAAGETVHSVFLAPDKRYELPVLTQQQAMRQLTLWLDAWQRGTATPLPVAFKSAMEFLRVHSSGKGDPREKAEQVYVQSNYSGLSECEQSPALQRTFPAFDDMQDFALWAERLYGGLLHWLAAEGAA